MSEQVVTGEDGEQQVVHFPEVKLIGGPLGRSLDLEVDGVKPSRVTGVSIEGDVGDVVRMTTHQIISLADVTLRVGGWEKTFTADVRVWNAKPGDPTLDEPIKIEGKGASASAALEDAVRQIKEIEVR